ncbi:transmembrane protein 214 isoform X1 [Physeter macrocephalus]|uniref:Transmembrane protein 214 isoform X1 n=2 Tax=Physeter macrocephalus TaxID=9755 RepID=A0A455C8Q1_PHYMC|nr:transmembrane protein 214 isoform X1 [Physeter catodon]|eukprot:XP_028352566.1 transmembrane protein 214 isoform X1 [Physeter catodon]
MSARIAGGGRWEVVKKGRRPGAGGSGKGGGGDRRALGEANGVWKYDLTPPIQTTSTLYERGFEKIMKRQNKEQVPPPAVEPKKPGNKKQTKKVATLTNQNQKQGRFRSLEEALKAFNHFPTSTPLLCTHNSTMRVLCPWQLDLAALQKELDKSQSVFSGNPSVWLKDLASYLNYKLQVPPSEPTLSQHTHDYPYSLVSRELRGIIRGLLAKAAGSLELFFDHCLFTMLQELDKTPGESLHGYRICIQAILQDKPKIATMNLGKFLELLRSHQSRPAKCLTIMWALGQAGFASLTEGLRVWLGIMLPVLGIRSLSPFAIAYLDRLLLMHPNLTKGFGMIGPKDLFPLLDFAYMPNNSLTPSLQEQLCQLYPRLKVLAFGAKPESTLHTYFPSFLSRATPGCPPEMKKELLSSLTECLTVDPLSTSVWRQLYPKHLSQSSLLLEHLLRSWERIPKKTQKSLQETIQSFKLTNQDLLGKGSCSNQDVITCDAACKSLLQQARGFWLPWTRLLLLVLVFAIGFVCHDFRSHSSFQASLSGRLLHSSGVLPAGQQACTKIYSYSLQGYSWLEETLPAWGSHLLTMVRPSLQLAWAHTNATVSFLSARCASHLAWFGDSLTSLSQRLQIQLPDALNQLLHSLRELLLFLHQNVLLPTWHMLLDALARVQEHCHEACRGGVTWDCVKTQLSEAAHQTWLCLQDTTVAFLDWAFAMISQQ